MDCTHCNGIACRQGGYCLASLLATRRVLGLHTSDGGHEVRGALSFPMELRNGEDAIRLPGVTPGPQPRPPRGWLRSFFTTSTPEGRARLIGAALGTAGALFIAWHLVF